LKDRQFNLKDTSIDYWDYRFLEDLYKNREISQVQVNDIVMNTISELLFDLAQEINASALTCTRKQDGSILDQPMVSTSANMFLQQMQSSWNNWADAGLAKISPDLAPVLKQPEELRQQVSPGAFNKFQKLINGERTLSDLAVEMKQSVLQIARSLLPFVRNGIAEFIEVSDSPLVNRRSNGHSVGKIRGGSHIPFIACVDDSLQICQTMEQIVTRQGMRYIGIQNSWEALPILLQAKPDLIFLDLIMPSVNGFEVCAQLRKISLFADTPIVILTASDGIFDHVKSKVFGATDFMTKPIAKNNVIGVINKHLPIASKAENLYSNLALCH
jgi:chemotaxis family two-component system response regulator PixG